LSGATREEQVLQTFAKLADTLVAGYEVVDLLQMLVDVCRDLLDADAAGILLVGDSGELEVVASTSEASRLVEMMQVSAEAGPCVESFRTGKPVSVPDLSGAPEEWREFRDAATAQGYGSTHAVPLRLRETTIGALNLFRTAAGELSDRDLVTAQAFADVATIGILHERALREHAVVTEQLQSALNSRVLIEQAKGVVAQRLGVTIDASFQIIRSYARSHQLGIGEVASRLVARTLILTTDATEVQARDESSPEA
jgi:transcriptional regulator with GAF, ATPase, and Fis domain